MRVPLDSSHLLKNARNVSPSEIPLDLQDNVLMFQDPTRRAPHLVVLSGQEGFQGRFTLETRGERIFELLGRAGEMTAEAYAEGRLLHTQPRLAREAQERLAAGAPETRRPPPRTPPRRRRPRPATGSLIRVGVELQKTIRGGRGDDLLGDFAAHPAGAADG